MKPPELPPFDHVPKKYTGPGFEEVMENRRRYLSPALITYYRNAVMLVEGRMQYLYDETGRRYLDGFGGIVTVSVGHCHPKVIRAGHDQMDRLQHVTTIYPHPVISEFGRSLAERLPGDLSVCYFVNSGSEANDLAAMMARLYTGNYDVIALRNAYHGGSAATMALTSHSTWKFNIPHNFGVQHAMMPDRYRGPWGYDDDEAGIKYASDVENLIQFGTSGRVAAFISEPIQGMGGTVVLPPDYLKHAYACVRDAGGLCISDEVQTGFTRTGSHYWGFESHGVVPDIVTMAKGIGNGAPLAAVVTTQKIAQTLASRIHFNTFGGNPVSCAMGRAVLDVIDEENRMETNHETGEYFLKGLKNLAGRHDIIGDVRGQGLMLGVELVKDRESKQPASDECSQVLERAKDMGLLIGKGGLHGNVLRIKPPMCISGEDVNFALEVLDAAFAEL